MCLSSVIVHYVISESSSSLSFAASITASTFATSTSHSRRQYSLHFFLHRRGRRHSPVIDAHGSGGRATPAATPVDDESMHQLSCRRSRRTLLGCFRTVRNLFLFFIVLVLFLYCLSKQIPRLLVVRIRGICGLLLFVCCLCVACQLTVFFVVLLPCKTSG